MEIRAWTDEDTASDKSSDYPNAIRLELLLFPVQSGTEFQRRRPSKYPQHPMEISPPPDAAPSALS